MECLIPNEVKELFNDSFFLHKLGLCFDGLDIKNQRYISTLNEDELLKLFKAYIAYNYSMIETDDEKIAYLHVLKREIILLSVTEGFIKMFIKASLSDRDVKENVGIDGLKLAKLKKFKNHKYIGLLSKYGKKIVRIISKEESYQFNKHRISLDELISLTKCLIVQEMIKNDNPYDIIKEIDHSDVLLDEYVLNAFSIYLSGIKTVDERKVERTFELSKLSKIITIAKSDDYLR